MRTTAPDVYAAGDVAQALDILGEDARVMPIWPSAYNQGLNAGMNMAGAGESYPGCLSMNAIPFFGLGTISVGLAGATGPEYDVHLHIDEQAPVYRKLVFRDDRLVGCLLIGDLENAGIYTSFVRNKLCVDEEARRQLISGAPSPLHWPAEFYQDRVCEERDPETCAVF
jgi:NAD(P)H-nitrite reductase large subunit